MNKMILIRETHIEPDRTIKFNDANSSRMYGFAHYLDRPSHDRFDRYRARREKTTTTGRHGRCFDQSSDPGYGDDNRCDMMRLSIGLIAPGPRSACPNKHAGSGTL
ncbi:hypothetical protein [Burkholderia ubonensis]|uniref:hypothetical protein n=1 Tax=Burkholderia ubonensis TaxID=101571 RepID=UPI000ACEDA3E|nr:hypothetical protein [Burkholderia ubonensis]